MDAQKFDRLAMTLSTTPTRRRLLTVLAKGTAGMTLAVLVATPGSQDVAAATCRTRQHRCSSKSSAVVTRVALSSARHWPVASTMTASHRRVLAAAASAAPRVSLPATAVARCSATVASALPDEPKCSRRPEANDCLLARARWLGPVPRLENRAGGASCRERRAGLTRAERSPESASANTPGQTPTRWRPGLGDGAVASAFLLTTGRYPGGAVSPARRMHPSDARGGRGAAR
jgi:hypothetical protein